MALGVIWPWAFHGIVLLKGRTVHVDVADLEVRFLGELFCLFRAGWGEDLCLGELGRRESHPRLSVVPFRIFRDVP
jgi:hypothetical protein